jgi:hypothetical protein
VRDSFSNPKGVADDQNLVQIGEPVEYRGIVVAPLFSRRDALADSRAGRPRLVNAPMGVGRDSIEA